MAYLDTARAGTSRRRVGRYRLISAAAVALAAGALSGCAGHTAAAPGTTTTTVAPQPPAGAAGHGKGGHHHSGTPTTKPGSQSGNPGGPVTPPAGWTGAGPLSPPPAPAHGAYLGAWVNANQVTGPGQRVGEPGSNETAQLPAFDAALGRAPAILHIYTDFKAPVPVDTVNTITTAGAVPMVDWGCSKLSDINSGADDTVISSYAQMLRAYAKPVFVRWYWEFNQDNPSARNCGGYGNGAAYIAAWRHIRTIFRASGTTNAAFVWCPGLSGGNFDTYYPGDAYVDWIAVDSYDHTAKGRGSGTFSGIFTSFYDEWVGHNLPMMVAETGATPFDQASYVNSIGADAPQFPAFKAVVYFDSIGPGSDWSLQGSGLSAFKTLAASPYFSFRA